MVLLPEEAGMTLSELRQMAARQQHQIEAQQQLLVAKEQRLKFLKQQEARHHNLSEQQLDTACLQNLREKVETQELKLRQLRALRGQVEQQKTNNGNLGTELDSIRALFSEKEKELNLAVNKVEELTRQLDEIRNNNNKKNCIVSPASVELENLRRELAYRTKLTEQQNNYICQQQENIALRQQDISLLDKKISELTKRLQRKRLLNEQLASQIHNASLSPHNSGNPVVTHNNNGLFYATTIVSIEPVLKEQEPEHTQDDMAAKLHGSHKGFLEGFSLAKNDPKYQTLPYNTKFTLKGKSSEESSLSSAEEESWTSVTITNSTIANQQSLSVKPSPSLGNLTPQPFSNGGSPDKPVPKSMPQQSKASNCLVSANNKDTSHEKTSIPIKNELPAIVPAATYGNNQQHSVTTENALNLQNVTKSRTQIETNRSNKLPKPIVPPKPTLPIKPMPPVRQSSVQKDQKTSQTNDALNNALSVLQNKSSEKDKSAISNYRERLLYYRCVPRYQHRDHTSEIINKSTSRIATYFPKPSTTPSDPNIHNTSKPVIDSCDVTDVPKRKSSFGQLPIRPKPLTIRKTPGLEPPKLKNQQNANLGLQRKTSDSNVLATHMKTSINSNFYMKSEPPQVVAPVKQPEMAEDVPITITASTNREEDSSKAAFVAKNVDVAIVEDVSPEVVGDVEIVSESKAPQKEESPELDEETSDSSEADSLEPKPDPPEEETVDLGKKEVILHSAAMRRVKGNLKNENSVRSPRRVSFDPLALLLDAALEGELELVKKTSGEVPNPSAANDEGITALHNAICAGHVEVVTFLVEFGCDVNAQDSDGWTPLHCAASCNNLPMVKFLVERGACVFATTLSDHETAAEKCEEEEEGFDGCSEYLYSLQENLGVMNNGVVYAVYDYDVQNADELTFKDGDKLEVLRKGDDEENEWWWSRLFDEEGYVPRNLLGLYPRVTCQKD